MSSTKWYRKNDANKEKQKKAVAERKRRLYSKYKEYKESLSCKHCGENNSVCLDFHHRDPSEKEASIAHMVTANGWCWERMMKEMKKCDVLCKNCHAKEHARLAQMEE